MIQGWLRTKRDEGFAFIEVNDGSSLANLQVVLNPELLDYEALLATEYRCLGGSDWGAGAFCW